MTTMAADRMAWTWRRDPDSCARTGCPGLPAGYDRDGRQHAYCSDVCRRLKAVSRQVEMTAKWADGRDVTAAYRLALDAEQAALADTVDAWSRFITARANASALRESGDDLPSAA